MTRLSDGKRTIEIPLPALPPLALRDTVRAPLRKSGDTGAQVPSADTSIRGRRAHRGGQTWLGPLPASLSSRRGWAIALEATSRPRRLESSLKFGSNLLCPHVAALVLDEHRRECNRYCLSDHQELRRLVTEWNDAKAGREHFAEIERISDRTPATVGLPCAYICPSAHLRSRLRFGRYCPIHFDVMADRP